MDSSGNRTVSKHIPLCDPFVWEDPRYIFRPFWHQLDRSRGVCASELTNQVVVVYLLAIVAGFALNLYANVAHGLILTILVASVYLIPVFLKLRDVEGFRTNFAGAETMASDDEDPDKILEQIRTDPEKEGFVVSQPSPDFNDIGVVGAPANPFNNILVSELTYAPTRGEAPDITSHEAKIALDDFFRVQWYSDPTDVFGKSQSQREFVTQPSTTIPNDQKSYQDWLYKIPGKTCKEGNSAACYGGTNGGALPWLNL